MSAGLPDYVVEPAGSLRSVYETDNEIAADWTARFLSIFVGAVNVLRTIGPGSHFVDKQFNRGVRVL